MPRYKDSFIRNENLFLKKIIFDEALVVARHVSLIFLIVFPLSLFNGISTFVCYLMPKLSLQKDSSRTIQPIAGGIKMDIITRLEFELAY